MVRKDRNLEQLIVLVPEQGSLYDPTSLDHMDAVGSGSLWATISMARLKSPVLTAHAARFGGQTETLTRGCRFAWMETQ